MPLRTGFFLLFFLGFCLVSEAFATYSSFGDRKKNGVNGSSSLQTYSLSQNPSKGYKGSTIQYMTHVVAEPEVKLDADGASVLNENGEPVILSQAPHGVPSTITVMNNMGLGQGLTRSKITQTSSPMPSQKTSPRESIPFRKPVVYVSG